MIRVGKYSAVVSLPSVPGRTSSVNPEVWTHDRKGDWGVGEEEGD
jgi:hypothetical protein